MNYADLKTSSRYKQIILTTIQQITVVRYRYTELYSGVM